VPIEELLESRYERYRRIGIFEEPPPPPEPEPEPETDSPAGAPAAD
jgi:hypothetical protein